MSCTLTVYQLKNFDNNDNWEDAWNFVEPNYGIDAICREVFNLDFTHDSVVNRLMSATLTGDEFFDFLLNEIEDGATHVFVHSLPKSKPIFGLKLSQLK
jgi:hypothetical protein